MSNPKYFLSPSKYRDALHNLAIKRNTITVEQENLCRFITFEYSIFKVSLTKSMYMNYERTGFKTERGLQIKNKIYLCDGKYKFVNRRSLKITEAHNSIPDWANALLIDKYKKFLSESSTRVK